MARSVRLMRTETRERAAPSIPSPPVGGDADRTRPASPTRGGGRYLFLLVGFTLLTIFMLWPLASQVGNAVVDHGDPLYDIWSMRWVQHQLGTDPAHLWDANILFPYDRTFVFSEPQLSTALLAWPLVLATGNDVLTYNLLLFGTFIALGVGTALLVEAWSGNLSAGALAGILAAYTPYRFGHISHLNLLSYGWLPLALWAIVRYGRSGRARDGALIALFLTLQLLASDTLAALALGTVGLLLPFILWRARARHGPRFYGGLALALGLPLLALLPLVLVRFEVQRRYGFTRDLGDIRQFSATLDTYRAVPPFNRFWRGTLPEAYPGPLFPGAVTVALALLGTPFALRRWPRRAGYALILALIGIVLSLGPELALGGRTIGLPYGWLYAHLPGMAAMRDPGRLGTLALLGLPLLAGLGVAAIGSALGPRLPRRWGVPLGTAALALLGLVALVEFRSDVPVVPVPRDPTTVAVYDWLREQPPGAVLELPANGLLVDEPQTIRQMYYSTRHWHPLVAGYTSYYPPGYLDFLLAFHGGPRALRERRAMSEVNAGNIGLLQDIGVRYVVLHRGGAYDWQRARAEADRLPALTALGEIGDAFVYTLDPGDRAPLGFTLGASQRATPGGQLIASLAVRNDNATAAVHLASEPHAAAYRWSDERGRSVLQGTLPVVVPAIEPGIAGLPLPLPVPDAPGDYRLRVWYGALAQPLDTPVTVAPAESGDQEGPALALAGVQGLGDRAQAGDTIALFLEWSVRGVPTENLKTTVQLLGPDGKLVSQADGPPFRRGRSPARWPVGAAVAQPVGLRIPRDTPPGEYRVLIALYDGDAPGNPRLPLALPGGTSATAAYLGPLLIGAP